MHSEEFTQLVWIHWRTKKVNTNYFPLTLKYYCSVLKPKYPKNTCSCRYPFCHHFRSLNFSLPFRIPYKSVSQPYFCLSRCRIYLFWLSLLPLWLQGLNAKAMPCRNTCWCWDLRMPVTSLWFVLHSWVALPFEWLQGQGPGNNQKSEWQLSSKQTPSSQTDVFRRQCLPLAFPTHLWA